MFGNITARRAIAEREIKFYFIARRIIAPRAIKLLIMQLYFPLTAEKMEAMRKLNEKLSDFCKKHASYKKILQRFKDLSLLSSE